MKTAITILLLSLLPLTIDADEISKAYSFISDSFKNPKTQPLGHYYDDEDGYAYTYEGESYKTKVVRVISNTKSCTGSVVLRLIKGSKDVGLWYPYDLNKQSFYLNNDLIALTSGDDNTTITLNYSFEDGNGKTHNEEVESDYIHFGWKAPGLTDLHLKQAFLEYSKLCKNSGFKKEQKPTN